MRRAIERSSRPGAGLTSSYRCSTSAPLWPWRTTQADEPCHRRGNPQRQEPRLLTTVKHSPFPCHRQAVRRTRAESVHLRLQGSRPRSTARFGGRDSTIVANRCDSSGPDARAAHLVQRETPGESAGERQRKGSFMGGPSTHPLAPFPRLPRCNPKTCGFPRYLAVALSYISSEPSALCSYDVGCPGRLRALRAGLRATRCRPCPTPHRSRRQPRTARAAFAVDAPPRGGRPTASLCTASRCCRRRPPTSLLTAVLPCALLPTPGPSRAGAAPAGATADDAPSLMEEVTPTCPSWATVRLNWQSLQPQTPTSAKSQRAVQDSTIRTNGGPSAHHATCRRPGPPSCRRAAGAPTAICRDISGLPHMRL